MFWHIQAIFHSLVVMSFRALLPRRPQWGFFYCFCGIHICPVGVLHLWYIWFCHEVCFTYLHYSAYICFNSTFLLQYVLDGGGTAAWLHTSCFVSQTIQSNIPSLFYMLICQNIYQMSQKWEIDTSFGISNHFFLNWLYSPESLAKKFFHKIGKKSETKEFTIQKKISLFKTQVIICKFKTHHRDWRSVINVELGFICI